MKNVEEQLKDKLWIALQADTTRHYRQFELDRRVWLLWYMRNRFLPRALMSWVNKVQEESYGKMLQVQSYT